MDVLNQNTTQNFMENNSTAIPQPIPVAAASSGVVYAGFFERFIAALIDGVLIGIANFVLGFVLGTVLGGAKWVQSVANLIAMAMAASYYVYFISQRGQTIGKKVMHLRVQNITTGQNLDVVSAILREIVGKFLSGVVLLLGYFWMLWDDKKQTWHDKIAKSIVVKVK
ncbi:MAG: RDD family protein [Patescibacteria group bacterium]